MTSNSSLSSLANRAEGACIGQSELSTTPESSITRHFVPFLFPFDIEVITTWNNLTLPVHQHSEH